MRSPQLRVRRATTDDFQSLKSLWNSMRLPADKLERRLTECQVVESGDGQIVGAIGLQVIRQHGLLHSEAYADSTVADAARLLFWERIQMVASHHGVFRLWTQENSPFWSHCGFRIVIIESLGQLPEEWKRFEGKWYSLQLKNEAALTTLDKELKTFRESEKQRTTQTLDHARTLRVAITVLGFGIFFICLAVLIYLITHRR